MDEKPDIDDDLDGCELDFTTNPTGDDETDLFVLFAEALDDANPKTVAEAETEWRAVL
jgi:hypothetical protein